MNNFVIITFTLVVLVSAYASADVKINSRGVYGYKRMAKKYENHWPMIPVTKTMYFKKNQGSMKMINSIPLSIRTSTAAAPVSANDLSAVDWSSSQNPSVHRNLGTLTRYIVGNADWLSLSTFSTTPSISRYPFTNSFATSDGPSPSNSTGIPYMYMTPNDLSWKDLEKDNRATAVLTIVGGYMCTNDDYQPDDLGCGSVILSGNVLKIPANSPEEAFAREAIYSRHAVIKRWKKDLGFFFVKLNITSVVMLNYIGGSFPIPLDDYFN